MSKGGGGTSAGQNRHTVTRHRLTDRLPAKLGEVEQDRDQGDREHVAAWQGDAGRDEDGLQAGHNCEKLRHGSPRWLPASVATPPGESPGATPVCDRPDIRLLPQRDNPALL